MHTARRCLWVVAALLALCSCDNPNGGTCGTTAPSGMSPGALPDAGLGVAYTQDITYEDPYGHGAALQWSISHGALPPGIALTYSGAVGRLAGVAATPGDYFFTLGAGTGSVAYFQAFSLRVVQNAPLVITTATLAGGTLGSAYSHELHATGGSGVGYTWSITSGALPPGLSLDGRNTTLSWGAFALSGNLDQGLGGGRLAEVSGMVASRTQPGVFWVHDDSGAGPEFYAVNAQGAVLQRYQLSATAQDWEDIALGPGPAGDCLFIGDFGDNSSVRTNCRVLRVAEPVVPATPAAPLSVGHDEFWFVYPGGPQNCETMLVDPETGTPYLVEKTAGAPRVHRFPLPLSSTWTSASPVTLVQVAATGTFDGTLTGGDAAADCRRMVLRGYGTAREYARPAGAGFESLFAQAGSTVAITGGQQHEAVCYSADGKRMFTCTELAGQPTAPIHVADAAPDTGATTISGTPTAAGSWSFTVQVRDSAGNTASRAFTIVVP